MQFRKFLEQIDPLQSLRQARSVQEMLAMYKNLSPEERKEVLNWINEINRQHYGKLLRTARPVLLHHGSPAKEIGDEGLKLTQGNRSLGFMGAMYPVTNQGVFLTDSKPVAHYFGSNRSKYGRDYEVYDVYANLDHVLDASNANSLPLQLRKMGLEMVNKYEGTKKNRLAQGDIWWLLDKPEFVNAIKQLGYTAIKFLESRGIRKQAGDLGASTYMVLDPKDMVVVNNKNNAIKTVDDLFMHLQGSI